MCLVGELNMGKRNTDHESRRRARRLLLEPLEDRRLLTATPQGEDFRVNQVVSGTQQLGGGGDAVAIDALGNFVVAYTGAGVNRTTEIFTQRFSPSGDRL